MSRIRARRATDRRRAAPKEDAAAFVARVAALPLDASDDCVPWPWSPDSHGYGRVMIAGVRRNVTHLVLEASGRPRPAAPANHALHSCDQPICVHPGHLRWGSMADNMADRSARGRHPTAGRTVTPEDVRAIRAAHAEHPSLDALSAQFGINKTTVHRIVTRRTWRGVR